MTLPKPILGDEAVAAPVPGMRQSWRGLLTTTLGVVLLLLAASPFKAKADHFSVLLVNVHSGDYDAESTNILTSLVDSGITARFVNLDTDGQVKTVLDQHTFDQIWVFDLSVDENPYPTDWAAVSSWFLTNPARGIICDARMISSYWTGLEASAKLLTQNYFANLQTAGGGLVLGTDHDGFQQGINEINALIGLQPFSGAFTLDVLPVDVGHQLMTTPNVLGASLPDDSTPGQVPFGLQPNGRILYTVAWHSGDRLTPGISTTIEKVAGYSISITAPAGNSEFALGSPVSLVAVDENGTGPFIYTWSSSKDGVIGSGLTLTTSSLSEGTHAITISAADAAGQIALDSISLTIRRQPATVLQIAPAVELFWTSVTGTKYQVQYATALAPTTWLEAGPVILGDGTSKSYFDSTRFAEKRFYRLQIVP